MGVPQLREGQARLPSEQSTKSYWHRDPCAELLGHRTTEALPTRADVVVVGSGITGAFAARFLKENLAKDGLVLMLEAREACWGATGRVSGFLHLVDFPLCTDGRPLQLAMHTYIYWHFYQTAGTCRMRYCCSGVELNAARVG